MDEFKKGDTASWDAQQVRRSQQEEHRHARKRRRRRINPVVYILVVLIISAILAGVGWLLICDLCAFNSGPITEVTVEISADDDMGDIADKLQDAGLIKYKWFFRLFAFVANADEKVGIGTYELNTDMDYRALIVGMHSSSGNLNSDNTVRITIPEGYTVQQTIALLAKNGVATEEELTEAAQTATFDYDFIDNDSQDISRLEGYLFPDTYDFYVPEKASSALNRLLANFADKMTQERVDEVESSEYSLQEIITIASLIEKETDGTDQATIASVIYNRLNNPSYETAGLLQIDASLLYALPDHEGAITNADKETDSPYNLYLYKGLPPAPIANPGLDAIKAALDPEKTGYFYYALGDDNTHSFFKTLDAQQRFLRTQTRYN